MEGKLVYIDAGHGGSDPGATREGIYEKDINLAVAVEVERNIVLLGHRVEQTRTTDTSVTLLERVRRINEKSPNLLVSIHCNASTNPSAKGIETWYKDISLRSMRLAKSIQIEAIATTEAVDRLVKNAGNNIYVLSKANMVAVLIEMGFISNPEERSLLVQPEYQNRLARAISLGIDKYLRG